MEELQDKGSGVHGFLTQAMGKLIQMQYYYFPIKFGINHKGITMKEQKKSLPPPDSEYFPQDLITSIFLRLPVKSLCRFKCVSKPWFSLITGSHFAKIHIRCQKQKLIISCNEQHLSEVYSMNFEPPYKIQNNITSPWKSPGIDITVTCNGLVLIPNSLSFCLWNPSTRHYKVISYPCTSRRLPVLYGFGYDASIDDYKVVYAENPSSVHIFTLETNTWRRTGNLPYDISSSSDHCILNGIIHWKVNMGVIYFNLTEERFGELPLPDNVENPSLCGLGILRGYLWITYRDEGLNVTVYTLKEYGVRESWTTFFSGSNFNPGFSIKQIWFEKEDESTFKMLQIEKGKYQLVIYKQIESNMDITRYKKIDRYVLGNAVATYVESTVSIPDGIPIPEEGNRPRRMGRVVKLFSGRLGFFILLFLIFAFVLALLFLGFHLLALRLLVEMVLEIV